MSLEENIRICRLIDIYGKLLTENQLKVLKDYYFENLSLTEIADNAGISRQAVNDSIKKSSGILETYEEKLKLFEKYKRLSEIEEELKTLGEDTSEIRKIINEIIEN